MGVGFIPYDKLSKKAKKELNQKKRKMWNVNPVTTKVDSKKIYNRQENNKIPIDIY